MSERTAGPSWLGIGAQRSGTTWFTDLVLRHPQVALPRDGRKEGHFFDRFLAQAWSDAEIARYHTLFDPARRSGEFTPAYLRSLWVPSLARRACGDGVVLLVLLRDPVERFFSAMRWYATRPEVPAPDERRRFLGWVRDKGNDALWGGMYATQLDAWASVFPRERFLVLVYEEIVRDPQRAADAFFRALGLDTVSVASDPSAARAASWNSTEGASVPEPWREAPGFRERLAALYAPEVARLRDGWGVTTSSWPSAR
jgi:hypothetical protein